jgi:hypothetical protein
LPSPSTYLITGQTLERATNLKLSQQPYKVHYAADRVEPPINTHHEYGNEFRSYRDIQKSAQPPTAAAATAARQARQSRWVGSSSAAVHLCNTATARRRHPRAPSPRQDSDAHDGHESRHDVRDDERHGSLGPRRPPARRHRAGARLPP